MASLSFSLWIILVICFFLGTTSGGLPNHRRKRDIKTDRHNHPEKTTPDPHEFLSTFLSSYSKTDISDAELSDSPVKVSSYTTVSEPLPIIDRQDLQVQPGDNFVTTFGTIAATVILGVGEAIVIFFKFIAKKKLFLAVIGLAVMSSFGLSGILTEDLQNTAVKAAGLGSQGGHGGQDGQGSQVQGGYGLWKWLVYMAGGQGGLGGHVGQGGQSGQGGQGSQGQGGHGGQGGQGSQDQGGHGLWTWLFGKDMAGGQGGQGGHSGQGQGGQGSQGQGGHGGQGDNGGQVQGGHENQGMGVQGGQDNQGGHRGQGGRLNAATYAIDPSNVIESSEVSALIGDVDGLESFISQGFKNLRNVVKLVAGDDAGENIAPRDEKLVDPMDLIVESLSYTSRGETDSPNIPKQISGETTSDQVRIAKSPTPSVTQSTSEISTSSSLITSTTSFKMSDFESYENNQTSLRKNEATDHEVDLNEYHQIIGMEEGFSHEAENYESNEDSTDREGVDMKNEATDHEVDLNEYHQIMGVEEGSNHETKNYENNEDLTYQDGVDMSEVSFKSVMGEEIPVEDNEFNQVEWVEAAQENIDVDIIENLEEMQLVKKDIEKVNAPGFVGSELKVLSYNEVMPNTQYQNLSDFDWLSETSPDNVTPAIEDENQPISRSDLPISTSRDPVVKKLLPLNKDYVSVHKNNQSDVNLRGSNPNEDDDDNLVMVTDGYKELLATLKSVEMDLFPTTVQPDPMIDQFDSEDLNEEVDFDVKKVPGVPITTSNIGDESSEDSSAVQENSAS